MANEQIQEGFEVFLSDADKPFGAVRQVSSHRRPELIVYVENAGDFTVALSAVKAIHSQKVIVDCDKLDHRLRKAIGHAHDSEDPKIRAPFRLRFLQRRFAQSREVKDVRASTIDHRHATPPDVSQLGPGGD